MGALLVDRGVNFINISLQLSESINGTTVTAEITLPSSDTQKERISQLVEYFSSTFQALRNYSVNDENRGATLVIPSCELIFKLVTKLM